MNHLCYFCLVELCFHAHLFVDALWSPAGKGLTRICDVSFLVSWFSGILGQVWCLIVSIPDPCPLSNIGDIDIKQEFDSEYPK